MQQVIDCTTLAKWHRMESSGKKLCFSNAVKLIFKIIEYFKYYSKLLDVRTVQKWLLIVKQCISLTDCELLAYIAPDIQ